MRVLEMAQRNCTKRCSLFLGAVGGRPTLALLRLAAGSVRRPPNPFRAKALRGVKLSFTLCAPEGTSIEPYRNAYVSATKAPGD